MSPDIHWDEDVNGHPVEPPDDDYEYVMDNGDEITPEMVVKVSPEVADDGETETETGVLLTPASNRKMKGTKWLMKGRIPAGMVTLLAGREGIGKSTLALDIAAQVTRGDADGRYRGKPRAVIICATEDSWEHTIQPRLVASKADLRLVYHVAIQDENGTVRSIRAPQDTNRIEKAFERIDPALMVLDPLMAVIDGRVDTHKQQEVQLALEPLVRMCDRRDMAILALIHVNKSGGTDPLNTIMGSKAFATLPRSVLYCVEDESEGQFLFSHVKCNVGPRADSIAYSITSVRFELDPADVEEGDDPFIETSRILWGDVTSRTAGDVLAEAVQQKSTGGTRKLILDVMRKAGQPMRPADIKAQLPDLNPNSIDGTLRRMDGKELDMLERGLYGLRS